MQGLASLSAAKQPNILWAGDMNWVQADGPTYLPEPWYAAFAHLAFIHEHVSMLTSVQAALHQASFTAMSTQTL